MLSFKLFNLKIKIAYSFVAFMTLLIAMDRTGLLFFTYIAVFVHEFGHLLALKLLKIKDFELILVLSSIKIEIKRILSKKEIAIIAFLGPFVNLIFSALVFLDNYYFKYLGASNIILFVFNILPLKGLDGGDILLYVFNLKEKTFLCISIVLTSFFTITVGGFLIFEYYNPTILIVGIYLIILSFRKV